MKNQGISLLGSVYIKENPEFLSQCFESIIEITKDRIYEVVLVQDGPLTKELEKVIANYEKKIIIKHIIINNNLGLGLALNEGLKNCSYNIVARFDTDDINIENRISLQIKEFLNDEELVILGGSIIEFENELKKEEFIYKIPPCSLEEIISYSKNRNPFNHMTIMFKKDKILEIGGYENVLFFEDYFLWKKAIHAKYKLKNLAQPLVYARAGSNMYRRRKGLSYAKKEFFFFKKCLDSGYISKLSFIKNIFLRLPIRLLPDYLIGLFYRIFLRN